MVKQAIRPAIVTWRHTEPELILCAVRWSLRDSLSFRDGEERLRERGLEADPTTIWRWVQHDGPELEERLRRHLKPTKRSWRVDETDVCVRGRWGSRSRALDSAGATIDVVRAGWRAAAAANRLFRQALPDPAHPRPRVINTDRARRLRLGDCQPATGRHPATPWPPPTGPLRAQHRGARSASDHTTRERHAGVS